MSFQARRLTIQLPCGDSSSIIETGAADTGLPDAAVVGGGSGWPPGIPRPEPTFPVAQLKVPAPKREEVISPYDDTGIPIPPPTHPCGWVSRFVPCEWTSRFAPPGPHERFTLDPEDLDLLKKSLESKIKTIEVAEHATAAVRRQVQAQLDDLGTVERALQERERE